LVADEILARIRNAGFNIVALKDMRLKHIEIKDLYSLNIKKPFFKDLEKLMTR